MQKNDEETQRAAVDGIVLAAGRSRRMGVAKATLAAGDATFIARVIDALRDGGCRDILAVIGADDAEAGSAASHAGARVVINTAEESEQIDSLGLALRNLNPGAEAALVLPVDHPLVTGSTVAALIDAYTARRPPIARATHGGAAGHPTLFDASTFEELLSGDQPDGARSVIAAHAHDVLDVEVADAGVTVDIDTPDDYRRHMGGDV